MTTVADPMTYPTVELAGQKYVVKFRCGDAIRLKAEHGIDLFALQSEKMRGTDGVDSIIKLLRAGLAHQVTYSVEELSDMIPLDQIRAIDKIVAEAIKKAFPTPTTAAPAPAETPLP